MKTSPNASPVNCLKRLSVCACLISLVACGANTDENSASNASTDKDFDPFKAALLRQNTDASASLGDGTSSAVTPLGTSSPSNDASPKAPQDPFKTYLDSHPAP